ncbi:MAG: GNAT family N-acetyltransferase [Planctomycetota bacterium]
MVRKSLARVSIHPVDSDRWSDLKRLFGEKGACAGCWCMWFRLPLSVFNQGRKSGNRRAMKRLVETNQLPGLLAYVDGEPAGWCAMAPRAAYPRLGRSRVLQPVDDQPVWSVTCFFIAKPFRKQGLTVRLLKAAATLARKSGVAILEGYPVDPSKPYADTFAFPGLLNSFKKAGFTEVSRRSPSRPIMRKILRVPRVNKTRRVEATQR